MTNPGLETKHLEWQGMEAPRYTSYPTAHHFTSSIGTDKLKNWLAAIRSHNTVSVYIHIPFCKELCWFCGCHTKVTRRYEAIERYVEVLLKEIELLKTAISETGQLVNINFGGGSPSLLDKKELTAIMEAVATLFGSAASGEIAIELDPRTTTAEAIELYAKLGFNRVSLGIQDFTAEVQQAINRIQPFEMVASCVAKLRECGIGQINFDLIYGLPHQTEEAFNETLDKTLLLNPSRIALFSYAHMPHIKKHQRLIDMNTLPSTGQKLSLYLLARQRLMENGYCEIGIDHFAKPDDSLSVAMQNRGLKRNFQGYVTETTDILLGLGCSAISQFPQGYMQNNASTAEYISLVNAGKLAARRGWEFCEDDLIRKHVIDELMCFLDIDLAKVRKEHSLPENYFAGAITELATDKYAEIVTIKGEKITVNSQYRMAARVVSCVFDQYRFTPDLKYSKVE